MANMAVPAWFPYFAVARRRVISAAFTLNAIRGNAMLRIAAILTLMLSFGMGAAKAQPFAPNEAGVTMGHWHLTTHDVAGTEKILVAMGGKAMKTGQFEIV